MGNGSALAARFEHTNVNDLLTALLGYSRRTEDLRSVVSGDITACLEWTDDSSVRMLYGYPVSAVSLLSVSEDFTIVGRKYRLLSPCGFALSRYPAGWYCGLYPPIDSSLSDIALRWLSEPMPELWLLALDRHSEPLYERVLLEELTSDMIGCWNMPLRLDGYDEEYICYGAWKVFPRGLSRLEWLHSAHRFHASGSVNPLNRRHLYPKSVYPAVLLRASDRQVCVLIDRHAPGWGGTHLDRHWRVVLDLHADYLALLTTAFGFTQLALQEIAALLCSWWLHTFAVLPPLLSRSAARGTSLLLTTDMIGRLRPHLRDLLLGMLGAWSDFHPWSADCLSALYSGAPVGDMYYPYAEHTVRCIGSHAHVYDSLRVMASQMGYSAPAALTPESYVELFESLRR